MKRLSHQSIARGVIFIITVAFFVSCSAIDQVTQTTAKSTS